MKLHLAAFAAAVVVLSGPAGADDLDKPIPAPMLDPANPAAI